MVTGHITRENNMLTSLSGWKNATITVEGGRLVAILLVAVVAVTVSQETVRFAHTHGESGIRCTRTGRQCLTGMRCASSRCTCPRSYSGNAEFECVKSKESVCYVTGDTRVRGFGGAGAPVNIPCSYRASRFITKKTGARSFCGIEVHVTNEAWRDTYRVRAVHVSVGVTEPGLQIQSNAETLVAGSSGANNSHTYSYKISTSPVDISTWGSAHYLVQSRSRVDLIHTTVDDTNNFVILDVPACDTRIKFRTFNPSKAKQPLLSGVSITVPDTAEFIHQMGDYPFSVCGRPRDHSSLYRGRASRLSLGSPANAILADVLEQRSPQFDNPTADQCQAAMDLYASSSDGRSDVKACGFLLNKKTTRRCLQNNKIVPIEVFAACLKVRQTSDDVNACSVFRMAASKCQNRWVGSKRNCEK